jgi:hypothetical protein
MGRIISGAVAIGAHVTVIRVSRDNITENKGKKDKAIVVSVFRNGTVENGYGAEIKGPSRLVYDGEAVWIETEAEVALVPRWEDINGAR